MAVSFWWQIFSNLSLSGTPGRPVAPAFQGFRCPRIRLVGVAQVAGIGNLHRIALRRRDEFESVGPHVDVRDGLFDS